MKELIELIEKEHLGSYKENVSFKNLTTYKTGGTARLVVYPDDVSLLKELLLYIKKNNISFKVFGNGSNILASDKNYDGVIIKLNHLNKLNFLDGKIEVEAGYSFCALAITVTRMGYKGLDFACGIPATVGGAVYMNAGAYLSDISEVLEKVDILDENLEFRTLNKDELGFSYRSSIFMRKNYIILKAYLKVTKDDKDELIELLEDRKMRRVTSQPLEYPSAGSVFRNPEGMYAGKLIEDAGLRGFQKGGGEISSKHANFIINKDNATSQDIKDLMDLAHDKVKKEYNVDLHREQELFNWE